MAKDPMTFGPSSGTPSGWKRAACALLVASSVVSGPAASIAAPAPPIAPAAGAVDGIAGDPVKPDAVAAVKAEIVVLHATNDGKGIDPSIGRMPELLKPPFSSYDTYKLIEKSDLELPKGTAKDKTLPDGGKLAVSLKDIVVAKKKGDPTRYVLSASIQKADGKTFLPGLEVNAVQGEYFFIAGQKFRGGIMVIGVRIR